MENVSGCTYLDLYKPNKFGRKLPSTIPKFRDKLLCRIVYLCLYHHTGGMLFIRVTRHLKEVSLQPWQAWRFNT